MIKLYERCDILVFNPYFVYSYSILLVLAVYQLNWSDIYPTLNIELLLFLLITGIVSLIIGIFVKRKQFIKFEEVDFNKKYYYVTVAIFVGYIIEFIFHRNIPLISIFTNSGLGYKDFGIPMFHVILVTFHSFFTIYLFHVYLSVRKRNILIVYLIMLIPPLLIVNRGMLVIILMSSVFVLLYQIKKLNYKYIVSLGAVGIVFLYCFGLFGNLRVNDSYDRDVSVFDSTIIMDVGGASEDFKDSIIPNSVFWAYTYIASPLANFQHTVNHAEFDESIYNNIPDYMTSQLIPDAIGKRINGSYFDEPVELNLISRELIVATIFAEGYVLLNWAGPIITFFYLIGISLLYILILKKYNSPFLITGMALMSSLFLLNSFDNMIKFSGLSLQLIFPLLFILYEVVKEKRRKWKEKNCKRVMASMFNNLDQLQ